MHSELHQPVTEVIQLLQRSIGQGQLTLPAPVDQSDFQAKRIGQILFQSGNIRRRPCVQHRLALPAGLARPLGSLACQTFDLTDIQALAVSLLREGDGVRGCD